MEKLQSNLKENPIYFFITWIITFSLITLFYNLFWSATVDAIYMKGFFNPSIYTTIFSVITIVILLINSSVVFLIKTFIKHKDKSYFLIILLHTVSFLTYFSSLVYFQNYYLKFFLRPSIELRESFNSYAYVSVFILSITFIFWLVMFSKYTLQLKSPIWLTVFLAILTAVLFEFYWLFVDVVSSM